jgi:imidazolonepropionase-like amidohydrolase
MRTFIRCGKLFPGTNGNVLLDHTLIFKDGVIAFAGPTARAPEPARDDELIDHSRHFVMPGLIDSHVHLSYGNARTQEDIDLYASLEFRAIRGLEAAQRVLRAGYTAMADLSISGRVSLAVRDAIEAGLFVGPRVSSSGRALTTRQGLDDWYPRWIGVPETSIGVLVRNVAEGIEEIRGQVKDGVNFVKLAMDGDAMNPATGMIAGFNREETSALITEIHRLGRKAVCHARGDEAVRYSARAGADVILHASWMDDEGLEAVIEHGCSLMPTLSLIVNNIEFTQPSDPCYPGFPDAHKRELEAAVSGLSKARAAGVPFMVGTDSGFAVTPYGEWHARELEHYVKYLGFTPAQALCRTTAGNTLLLKEGDKIGRLEAGCYADAVAVEGNPLQDIAVLQDRSRLAAVYKAGEAAKLAINDNVRRLSSELSYQLWRDVYTQDRVAKLRNDFPASKRPH